MGNREVRVLIIDDDQVSLELLQSTLENWGAVTRTLPSPIGASRMITQHDIDVVVLDLNLPHLSGDNVAHMLRRQPRTRHVGLVLVSGCKEDDLVATSLKVGADGCVQKRQIRKELTMAVARAHVAARDRKKSQTTNG